MKKQTMTRVSIAAAILACGAVVAAEETGTEAAAQPPAPGWQPKQSIIEARSKKRSGMNFDESRVPEYSLPDPLALESGQAVTKPQDWS